MNSKSFKVIGAVVISLLVMIIVVIYTPKPTTQPVKNKKALQERIEKESTHLKLTRDALVKVLEVNKKIIEKIERPTVNYEKALKTLRILINEIKQIKEENLKRKSVNAAAKAVRAIDVSHGNRQDKKANNGQAQPSQKINQQSLFEAFNDAIQSLHEVEKAILSRNDQTQPLNGKTKQYKSLNETNTKLIEALKEIENTIKASKKSEFKPLVEMNNKVSVALSEATEAIKTRNVELKHLNEKNAKLKQLMERNINMNNQLLGVLIEMDKVTKATTKEMQSLNDRKVDFQPLIKIIRKMTNTAKFAQKTLQDALYAYYEYQQAQIKNLQ